MHRTRSLCLSHWLSLCLSLWLSFFVSLSPSLSLCSSDCHHPLYASLCFSLSICLPISVSACLSVSLTVSVSGCLCLSVYLTAICLFVSLCLTLAPFTLSLSLYLSVSFFYSHSLSLSVYLSQSLCFPRLLMMTLSKLSARSDLTVLYQRAVPDVQLFSRTVKRYSFLECVITKCSLAYWWMCRPHKRTA